MWAGGVGNGLELAEGRRASGGRWEEAKEARKGEMALGGRGRGGRDSAGESAGDKRDAGLLDSEEGSLWWTRTSAQVKRVGGVRRSEVSHAGRWHEEKVTIHDAGRGESKPAESLKKRVMDGKR